mgnify:CR=1 FL=1
MKPENRVFLNAFFSTGLIYATLMAGLDYYFDEVFKLAKFLFRFFFFGLFMGLLARNNTKNQLIKKNNESQKK